MRTCSGTGRYAGAHAPIAFNGDACPTCSLLMTVSELRDRLDEIESAKDAIDTAKAAGIVPARCRLGCGRPVACEGSGFVGWDLCVDCAERLIETARMVVRSLDRKSAFHRDVQIVGDDGPLGPVGMAVLDVLKKRAESVGPAPVADDRSALSAKIVDALHCYGSFQNLVTLANCTESMGALRRIVAGVLADHDRNATRADGAPCVVGLGALVADELRRRDCLIADKSNMRAERIIDGIIGDYFRGSV